MAEAWLEEISHEECLSLLRAGTVGRIAFMVDEFPVVLPVNYRVFDLGGRPWLALRTRQGNVIDQAPMHVAFEVDGIGPVLPEGWSVLVRGKLDHVNPAAAGVHSRYDSEPWLEAERDSWLVIEPVVITGRRLHAAPPEWAFHIRAYL
jgi:nitroimidazol reductase NimA-like FMN-containing flavoprotein (pyridoxamine 5'-phosphate oxidase superfamily)